MSLPRDTTASGDDEEDRPGPSFWARLRRWSGLPAADNGSDGADDGRKVALDPEEQALIRNVLRLRTLTAAEIMVPRVDIVAVDVETSFAELVAQMVEEGHSRMPVYRGDLDHIIGMIHVKDVMGFVVARRTTTIVNLMRKVLFVAPSTGALDLLSQMRLQHVHMAFVVDEFGGIDGLITIEDVVEEIVGEIEDEHDEAEPQRIVEKPDGSLLVDARTTIDELEEQLGVGLLDEEEAEEVDTVGGLVVILAGHVPAGGEIVAHPSGIGFEIIGADERRIHKVRIARPVEETGTENDG